MDWWVYALVPVDKWNNSFHVPTEQNIDAVSQFRRWTVTAGLVPIYKTMLILTQRLYSAE